MTERIAPHNTGETAAYLRLAHEGPLAWTRMCLAVQRTARGLPAIYPSAAAAAAATPEEDRVYKLDDVRRGMVMYYDDKADSNVAGHIVFCCGRDKDGRILTWSNDMLRAGGIDMVYADLFTSRWGDPFQFAATSLNGYKFPDFIPKAEKPKVLRSGRLGDHFQNAMDELDTAIKRHKAKGHDELVLVLQRDLKRMQRQAARYK